MSISSPEALARRWLSFGGLLTVLIGASWLWLGLQFWILASLAATPPDPLFPGAPVTDAPRLSIFATAVPMLVASAALCRAALAAERGNRGRAIGGHVLAVVCALAFVVLQVYRLSQPAFGSSDLIGGMGMIVAGYHAWYLIAGIGLIGVSALMLIVQRAHGRLGLASQAAIWNWHMVDTGWLLLLAIAWHAGFLGSL